LGREYSVVAYAKGFQDMEDIVSFMSLMALKSAASEIQILKPEKSRMYGEGDSRIIKKVIPKFIQGFEPGSVIVRVWWD